MGTWRIIAMLVWLTGNLTLPPQDKSAVPPESEIKAAEKTLQQAYKVEFSTQDRVARRAATVKLLSDASAIKSQPEQYALLQAVITMALGVQDPWTSLRAAEQIDKRFTVNLAELKAQIVAAAKKQATAPLDAMIATEFCLTLWESSLEAGDFENAIAWGKTAEQLAKSAKDPALAQSAKDMTAEAEQCKKDRERSLVAETALGTGSDDPAAHTDLGIYLCFVRADWDKGCLHLSKGIEGSLKELAVKEQLKLTDAESKLGISMAWRTAGEREKITHIRKRFLVRSCYWQEEALKAADPVTKRKIAKKIAGSAVLLKGTYAMGKSSSDVTAKMQEVLENDPRAPFIADYYVAGPQQPGEARGITVECQQGKDWSKNTVGEWEAATVPFISTRGTPVPEATFRFSLIELTIVLDSVRWTLPIWHEQRFPIPTPSTPLVSRPPTPFPASTRASSSSSTATVEGSSDALDKRKRRPLFSDRTISHWEEP